MKKRYSTATAVLLALALLVISAPHAAASGDEQPIRLRATASYGPIATLTSMSDYTINGRLARGEQPIWGSELVQAPAHAGLRIVYDAAGEITLSRGALARFSRTESMTGEAGPVVIASLLAGEMRVRLAPDAAAFIHAAGAAVRGSNGAQFDLAIRDGELSVTKLAGEVLTEQQQQRRYIVRPVGLGSGLSVRARSTRQIQVQVTDENDNPVPDLPIIFTLSSQGGQIGSLGGGTATSATVTTNSQGMATVNFTAGDNPGTTEITAQVEGTRYSWTGTINVVTAPTGFWTARNTWIVVGAVAAGVGAGVAIAASGDDDNVRPIPPPRVTP